MKKQVLLAGLIGTMLTSGLPAAMAASAPLSFSYNGMLWDSNDQLVSGEKSIEVKLIDANNNTIGTGSTSNVSNGFYSVKIMDIDQEKLMAANGKLNLQISVDGNALSPNLSVDSVPFAVVANYADAAGSVSCDGCIDISNLSSTLVSQINNSSSSTGDISNIDASKITSGILNADRIPGLSAKKITSDQLDVARIPNLSASKITSGTLNVDRIPSLDASKITTGTIDINRLPSTVKTAASNFATLTTNVTNIQKNFTDFSSQAATWIQGKDAWHNAWDTPISRAYATSPITWGYITFKCNAAQLYELDDDNYYWRCTNVTTTVGDVFGKVSVKRATTGTYQVTLDASMGTVGAAFVSGGSWTSHTKVQAYPGTQVFDIVVTRHNNLYGIEPFYEAKQDANNNTAQHYINNYGLTYLSYVIYGTKK